MAGEQARLEQQVRQRTQELERMTVSLQAEIDERRRIEQMRQQLLQKLEDAQEAERHRISRELHDQLGQNVVGLVLKVDALEQWAQGNTELQGIIAQIQTLAMQINQDVHTLAVQLRPTALDDLRLVAALTSYVNEWSTRALVPIEFTATGLKDTRLPPAVETVVYRTVQEALTNVLRHAQASKVNVLLYRHTNSVRILVEDDGIGFDPDTRRQQARTEHRIGLLGIEERLAHLNGSLAIESIPGQGTVLIVTIPLTP